MIAPIFKDKKLQKIFDEKGYVKIPLLKESDVQILTQLFYQFHSNIKENTFGASSFLFEKNKKLIIRDVLFPIFQPYFDNIFENYTYFGSSFLYKTKGKNSDLAPHQDWTIVDEQKYVAINIWIPLVDTFPENGTLYVLPSSQAQKYFTLRAPTIPFYFLRYMDTVSKLCEPTNAKAGEAVILNQSLIHYSTPNIKENIRIAITSGIKSKNAPMLFHYKNDEKEIERYEMPEDFLLAFNDFHTSIYQRPTNGKLLSIINFKNPNIGKLKFIQKFGDERLSFWGKVFKLIR